MMNGRISPYSTRNIKQDVASAIVSAGLLGQFGSELLREHSGLHPIPNKKKAILPELPFQKKLKPPPEDGSSLNASPNLEMTKKKLGDIPQTQHTTENNNTTTENTQLSTNNDVDILEDDLHTSSPQPDSSHPSISPPIPRESPFTPTFPDPQPQPPTVTSTSTTPSLGPTPGFNSTKIPGFGATKKQKLPKQDSSSQEVDIPPTKIPEKYHVADQYPIRPHPFEEGEALAFSGQGGGWQKKWFPSDKPQGRREVLQLIRTFEVMLDDLAAPQQHQQQIQSNNSTPPPLSDIEKEQTIYDTILHEIIRQVTVECADRGVLLEKISRRYRRLFARVPLILSEMQQEIDGLVDANKSLRLLLERLMETKSEAEMQVKETRDRILETEQINAACVKEIEQSKTIIQKLTKERDDAEEEAKREEERHRYQERVNSELISKDQYNKVTITTMAKQLEDALNSLHTMEAKYLSLKTQQQQEMKKVVKQATLEFDERINQLSASLSVKTEKSETKPEEEEEEEEEEEGEGEGEDGATETNQSRPSTTETLKERKKKLKMAKSTSPTAKRRSKEKKEKEREKEKEKEGEGEGSLLPVRARTPTKVTKATSPKPTSPSLKTRGSFRMSGRSLSAPDGVDGSGENDQ